MRRCERPGLTVLELFFVLAIISILLALLLPAVQHARQRARETVCQNNLRQLNLAVAQYVEVHKSLPPRVEADRVGGWAVEILPFLEQTNLANRIQPGLSLADVPEAFHRPPKILLCPIQDPVDDASGAKVWPAQYVLSSASGRESFLLFDSPLDRQLPWLAGPEMPYQAIVKSQGPHHGGFYFVRGFQQGVSFMVNGSEVR